MEPSYQPSREQSVVRHHVRRRQRLPTTELPARLRQGAQDQRVIQGVQPANDAGQERRDEVSLQPGSLYRPRHQLLHAADFDLYIKEGRPSVTAQDLFESRRHLPAQRNCGMQLLEIASSHHQSMEFWIVAENGLAVAGPADVKLKAVGAVEQCKVESGDGVFRGATPGAAMSEQQDLGQSRQSRSKSRIIGPSSGLSLAFFTASWNFFSSRSALFFSAATAC